MLYSKGVILLGVFSHWPTDPQYQTTETEMSLKSHLWGGGGDAFKFTMMLLVLVQFPWHFHSERCSCWRKVYSVIRLLKPSMTVDHCLPRPLMLYHTASRLSSEAWPIQKHRISHLYFLYRCIFQPAPFLTAPNCRQMKMNFTGFSVLIREDLTGLLSVQCSPSPVVEAYSCGGAMMFTPAAQERLCGRIMVKC